MLSLKRDPTLQLTIGIFWVFFRHRTLIVSEAPPYNLNILVFEIFCVLFRHCTLTYCPVRYRTKEEVEKVFEQNVHRVLCPLNIFCQFMTKIFSFKRIIWMRPHCTSRINQIKSSYLTEPASRKAKPHWEEKDFFSKLERLYFAIFHLIEISLRVSIQSEGIMMMTMMTCMKKMSMATTIRKKWSVFFERISKSTFKTWGWFSDVVVLLAIMLIAV